MNRCLDRNQIEEYLSGWADPAAGEQIESHLAECEQCEQTVNQLEQETDSFFQPIGSPAAAIESATPDDPMQQVLQTVRQWNPVEIASNPEPKSADRPFPASDFGPFEIVELIGRGGMAEVYRARHKRLDRDVAIKLLPVPQGKVQESLERIDREIRAVGRLRHPAIVSAVDAGEYNRIPYLATEYIDGFDLGKIVRRVQKLDIADACEIVRQVALGLDYAHANGVIHRDIKPSNIMLDRNGTVKILDFGLVRLDQRSGVPAELTSVGQLLGTLDYMAPEQADRADSVDHRSDIYSLGATLFRLLAGRAPYAATANQSPLEKLRLLAVDQPPHIQTLRPDLPDPLAKLVDQTLARDPSQRPASAAHLAEALLPFCEGADTSAVVAQVSSIGAINFEEKFGYSSEASLLASSHIPAKPATAGGSSRGTSIRRWLIAAGFAAAAVVAGIILVLELQKGRVIIETESANLNVSLVEVDSGRSQEVQVFPGENSTRIQAGRYEIRIDDGSDRYVLQQNGFVLKRGETVVAKIQVDSDNGTADITWSDNSRAYTHQPKRQDLKSGTQATTRLLRTYEVTRDPNFIVDVIGSILPETQGVRIQADSDLSQIIAFANQEQHVEIERILKELDASPKTNADVAQALEEKTLDTKIASPSDGPLYEGKSLAEWVSLGESDLSRDVRKQAIAAIGTIAYNDFQSLEQVRNYLAERQLPRNSIQWEGALAATVGLRDSHIDRLLNQLKSGAQPEILQILELLQSDAHYRNRRDEKGINDSIIRSIEIVNSQIAKLTEREIVELRQQINKLFASRPNPLFDEIHGVLINPEKFKPFVKSAFDFDWLTPTEFYIWQQRFRDKSVFVEAAKRQLLQNDRPLNDQDFRSITQILENYLQQDESIGTDQASRKILHELLVTLDQYLLSLAKNHETDWAAKANQSFLFSYEDLDKVSRIMNRRYQADSTLRNRFWNYDASTNLFKIRSTILLMFMEKCRRKLGTQEPISTPGLEAFVAATNESHSLFMQKIKQRLAEHDSSAILDRISISPAIDRYPDLLDVSIFGSVEQGKVVDNKIGEVNDADNTAGEAGKGRSDAASDAKPIDNTRSARQRTPVATMELSQSLVNTAILHDVAHGILASFSTEEE